MTARKSLPCSVTIQTCRSCSCDRWLGVDGGSSTYRGRGAEDPFEKTGNVENIYLVKSQRQNSKIISNIFYIC